MKQSNPSRHTEWLSLVEVSGPFLAISVLEEAFPQGLDVVETPKRQRLRAAYEEWRDAVEEDDPLLPDLHREWIRLVFSEILEYDGSTLKTEAAKAAEHIVSSPERTESFEADWLIVSPSDGKPRLFVSIQPPDTDFEKVRKDASWPASLLERMTALCRAHGVRLGLITDGERWMLVNAPSGATSSDASWYARLWFQEPVTLKAFQSLLGVRRCFGPEGETLEALIKESLEHHEEITDTLGEQVRRAVEVLVQCLDKADADRNRELLRDVSPAQLYEAGLTVMMRLVFLLCAEERGLLLSGDPLYDECYAVSTLRSQLAEEADRHGPEVLDRRHDAWARLLSLFRAVYGGIDHENLRMPALGGSLFDPDRFPFLEGRPKGTSWRNTDATPLPIDNRTVLLLLSSLQLLEQHGGALLLSYRALDVEHIGHVYEGLLEHTVTRVPSVTIGLIGSKKAKNPNLPLSELESARMDGEDTLIGLLKETTERSESAIRNALARPVEDSTFGRLLSVCGADAVLAERIRPFANLLRTDAWEEPIVYREKAFMVTLGADRRETGTHYTPKSLTESIVKTTLEPVVYVGPAEGKSRDEWKLKTPSELLDLRICDPAMGSGAFLVQACRWLAERLVEAWAAEETKGRFITVDGEVREAPGNADPMSTALDERILAARRLIAEGCLYGVDVNPLAVELANLSIWLVTLAKGRPFGFLDHNLRHGDSLLGIHRLDQLTRLKIEPDKGQYQERMFGQKVSEAVAQAVKIRARLRMTPIRDIRDVETMSRLENEARNKIEAVERLADAMIGEILRRNWNDNSIDSALDYLAIQGSGLLNGDKAIAAAIVRETGDMLSVDLPPGKPPRKPFHWPLEFPEVFMRESSGFDAIVGNPPFLGGKKITGVFGACYREYLVQHLASNKRGHADLVAYFFLRATALIGAGRSFGLLASNSIAEGDTRDVGLAQISEKHRVIYWAVRSELWPGRAKVATSRVHLFTGEWKGEKFLDNKLVPNISENLTVRDNWHPKKIVSNLNLCFQGSIILSLGFTMLPERAEAIISRKQQYKDKVLFPYLIGKELNSMSVPSPERWVINFWDWSESKAREFPDLISQVNDLVKPERDALKDNPTSRGYKRYWWRFGRDGRNLYHMIGRGSLFESHPRNLNYPSSPLERVIVFATGATKYPCFTFVPNIYIYANSLCVIASQSYALFACLSSDIHSIWAFEHGSRLEERLRYTHGDIFETFPFPYGVLEDRHAELAEIGQRYFEARQAYMLQNDKGMTKFYNDVHNHTLNHEEIKRIRAIRIEINNCVLKAYGYRNLNPDYGFHEVSYLPQGKNVRYTISETVREELLYRLSELNREKYKRAMKAIPKAKTLLGSKPHVKS